MLPHFKDNSLFNTATEFRASPIDFAVKYQRTLGEFYSFSLFHKKIHVLSSPEGIKHVLQSNQKNYRKSVAYKQLALALGNGLVTSEGEFWRKQRRMAQPAFYKTQLEALYKKMRTVAVNYVEQLETQRGKVLDISQEMMNVTADIALASLFSSANMADQEELYQLITEAQEYVIERVHNPLLIPFFHINGRHSRFKKQLKKFNKMIYQIIDKRREMTNTPADLLAMLLDAKDADTGEGMNNQQLRDEAITIFTAGHETSANALSWTLWLLAERPEIVAKIKQEIKQNIGDNIPNFEDLRQFPYIRQVIEEGMRMYPPAHAVGREAIVADEIMGVKIPKNGIIFMSIYALHHNEKYWDAPFEFNPDRFSPERVKAQTKMTYLPFGAGPRMCIGNHFAMMEMQLLLIVLFQKFDLENVPQTVEKNPLITLKPKVGIKLKLK